MSGGLMDKVHQLASLLPQPQFEDSDVAAINAGRQFADEFVSAVRGGPADPDLLIYALTLATKANGTFVRGFMRQIQCVVAEGSA